MVKNVASFGLILALLLAVLVLSTLYAMYEALTGKFDRSKRRLAQIEKFKRQPGILPKGKTQRIA